MRNEHGRALIKVTILTLILWCLNGFAFLAAAPPVAVNQTGIGVDPDLFQQVQQELEYCRQNGNWTVLAQLYQRFVEEQSHVLYTTDGRLYRPLHWFLYAQIKNFPAALATYRQCFDGRAQRLFLKARRSWQAARLESLGKRFLPSSIAAKALYLAAVWYLDQGQYAPAARLLVRLLPQSKVPGACLDSKIPPAYILTRLAWCYARLGAKKRLARVCQALREQISLLPPRQRQAVMPLLEKWRQADRPAPASGVAQVGRQEMAAILAQPQWQAQLVANPVNLQGIKRLQRYYGPGYLPAVQLLIDQDVVYCKTGQGLVAFDLITGKALWHGATKENGLGLLRSPRWSLVAWRLLCDLISTQLSAFQGQIGSIEDNYPRGAALRLRVGTTIRGDSNRLIVYDSMEQGRIVMRLGQGQGPAQLQHVKFMGPPVYYQGQLYVVYVRQERYYMSALRADTGKLLWETYLCDELSSNHPQALPPMEGAPLVVKHGYCYWVSHNGIIVALDAHYGQVQWLRKYTRVADRNYRNRFGRRIFYRRAIFPQWQNQKPLVCQGRLVVAPRDSGNLLLLDTSNGKIKGQIPCQENIHYRYVLGTFQGLLLLAGRDVGAVSLASGKYCWRLHLRDAGSPTGRGMIVNGLIYLPMGKKIVTVRAVDGQRQQDISLPDSKPLGNLCYYQHLVLAVNPTTLRVFGRLGSDYVHSLEACLARTPHQPRLYLQRGRYWQRQGNFERALRDFQQAQRLANIPRYHSWQPLVARYLFKFYLARGKADDFQQALRFATKPSERVMVQLAQAQRWEAQGQWERVLQCYRQLQAQSAQVWLHLRPGLQATTAWELARRWQTLESAQPQLLPAYDPAKQPASQWKTLLQQFPPGHWADRLRLRLAVQLLPQRRYHLARQLLEQVVRHTPGTPQALQALMTSIHLFRAQGQDEQVVQVLERIITGDCGHLTWQGQPAKLWAAKERARYANRPMSQPPSVSSHPHKAWQVRLQRSANIPFPIENDSQGLLIAYLDSLEYRCIASGKVRWRALQVKPYKPSTRRYAPMHIDARRPPTAPYAVSHGPHIIWAHNCGITAIKRHGGKLVWHLPWPAKWQQFHIPRNLSFGQCPANFSATYAYDPPHLIVAAAQRYLMAVNLDTGRQIWSYDGGQGSYACGLPAVCGPHLAWLVVYPAQQRACFTLLATASGQVRLQTPLTGQVQSFLHLMPQAWAVVLIEGRIHLFDCLAARPLLCWKPVKGLLSVMPCARILLGLSNQGELLALDPARATVKWRNTHFREVTTIVAATADEHHYYVVTCRQQGLWRERSRYRHHRVYALDPENGKILWKIKLGRYDRHITNLRLSACPATVVLQLQNGFSNLVIYVIDKRQGRITWQQHTYIRNYWSRQYVFSSLVGPYLVLPQDYQLQVYR